MGKEVVFFESPARFRAWLRKNHKTAAELHVGYWKVRAVAGGRKSMTWQESVKEALCFGWIDGIRRRLDEDRYVIRFTPRRPRSVWSAINIRLVKELEASGRMMEAGRAVFAARPHKTGPKAKGYTYERREAELDAGSLRSFRRERGAWEFYEGQPPWYRRLTAWWVMSAKKEETKARRLAKLIEWSGRGKRV